MEYKKTDLGILLDDCKIRNPLKNDCKIEVEVVGMNTIISLNGVSYIIDKYDTIEAQRIFLECLGEIMFKR